VECEYLDSEMGQELSNIYDEILVILVKIINNPEPWLLKTRLGKIEIEIENKMILSRHNYLQNVLTRLTLSK
jgi:hypothetical protein